MTSCTRRKYYGVAVLIAGSLISSEASAATAAHSGDAERHTGPQAAVHEGARSAAPAARYASAEQTLGHDVSAWQGDVDWQAAQQAGAEFVYIKATEGTGYTNEHFTQQYTGSHDVGMIRGAYHFARPDISDGATQAKYFLAHGGDWSPDTRTLPGALDLEKHPRAEACYGMAPQSMVTWIKSFTDTYTARTGHAPVIYTSTQWWNKCTGNSSAFGATNPLWLARYDSDPGPLPAGWHTHTIWQFSNTGKLPGDQNYFNGNKDQLIALTQG